MPEGCRAAFEMVSSLFSTKISFSFINIRICVCPLRKVSVLLQLSTFLLPITEVLDGKYYKSCHNLHINNGGVIFMAIRIIGRTVHWCRRTHFCMLSLISEKGKTRNINMKSIAFLDEMLTVLNPPKQEA